MDASQQPLSTCLQLAATAAGLCVLILAPAASHAAAIFYTDQTAFDAAEPGATTVSFSGLSNGIRPNGFALPGVTFSTLAPGLPSSALIVYGGHLGNNWFGDTLVLNFAPGTSAVGADILNEIGEPGATPQIAPITEDVYAGSTLIGHTTVTESSGFFGVTSANPITEVTFFSDCQSDCSSLLSNLSLAPTAATAVPEPGGLELILAGLGIMAVVAHRRKA